MSKSKPSKPKPKKPATAIAAKLIQADKRAQFDRSAVLRGGGKLSSTPKTHATHRSKNG